MDFIYNGAGHGSVANVLLSHNGDTGALRPFISDKDGRSYMTVNEGGKDRNVFIGNNTATLRYRDWVLLDQAVIRAAKPRLRVFGDLRQMGLEFNIPEGMGKSVLQYQTISDITPATLSMNGLRVSEQDRPVFDLRNLPLPIIHKDFSFSLREILASRNGGSPLDTSTAELAARRCAEQAEQLTLGTAATYAYGGGTIYGYTNFPNRITYSLSDPTQPGWNGAMTVADILAMKNLSQLHFHYGPWMVYTSTGFDYYMDDDYSAAKGINTLRQRIGMIDNIIGVKTADYLTGYQIILVQATPDVARAVIGMDMQTIQWESHGGMQLNFKVMAIMVPQLRSDANNNSGIVHGSV